MSGSGSEPAVFATSLTAFILIALAAPLHIASTLAWRAWAPVKRSLLWALLGVHVGAAVLLTVSASSLDPPCDTAFCMFESWRYTVFMGVPACAGVVAAACNFLARCGRRVWPLPLSVVVLADVAAVWYLAYERDLVYQSDNTKFLASTPAFLLPVYVYAAGLGRAVAHRRFALHICYWMYMVAPLVAALVSVGTHEPPEVAAVYFQVFTAWFLQAYAVASLVFVVDRGEEDRLRKPIEFILPPRERF